MLVVGSSVHTLLVREVRTVTAKTTGPAQRIPSSSYPGGRKAEQWQPVLAALCCVAVFAAVLVAVAWSSTSAWGPLALVAVVAGGGGIGWLVSRAVLGRRDL